MSSIPGAEFAPILTRTVIDLGPEGSEYQLEREIRWCADVSDPDDQRAIWRLAAMALGATEEEAALAILDVTPTDRSYPVPVWTLLCPLKRQAWRRIEFKALGQHRDRAHATAALCRAVGWPR